MFLKIILKAHNIGVYFQNHKHTLSHNNTMISYTDLTEDAALSAGGVYPPPSLKNCGVPWSQFDADIH